MIETFILIVDSGVALDLLLRVKRHPMTVKVLTVTKTTAARVYITIRAPFLVEFWNKY